MKILAIDPGNEISAYVFMGDSDDRPSRFGRTENDYLREIIAEKANEIDAVVIERVASYGMPVGRDVFETCEWVGRFCEVATHCGVQVDYIYRKEEKEIICRDLRAKDSNIRRALIDRFADHDFKNGKGTKKNPDYFYGFGKDDWAAFAIGHTYFEKRRQESL